MGRFSKSLAGLANTANGLRSLDFATGELKEAGLARNHKVLSAAGREGFAHLCSRLEVSEMAGVCTRVTTHPSASSHVGADRDAGTPGTRVAD
jgi:hypothetical protein